MNKKIWIPIVVVVAGLVVAGVATWYFVFRDDAPPAVTLERATESLDDTDTATTATSTPAGIDGTWKVDRTIGSFSDFSSSFAGFRVQEELVGIGGKTAVGRTPNVTGTMRIAGSTVPEASFTVDMTTLTTDDSRRDNAIRMQAIETSRFPTATFTLTQPIQLGSVPAEGQKLSVDATGNLTLHGVTKPVTIPLEAQRNGAVVTVVGSLPIAFSDYSINKPSAATVLSVDDKGVMEVQLRFTKS